jgi:hypothetical protein
MFRYSLLLDTLFKALTHKYIRRVPKGVTKTGKTKYMYFYAGQEGHGRGIAHEEELVTGASFAFGEVGKTRYHAHITKVDGDKVTVRYDDGDKKGTEETMNKKQFQALVHGEHATGIKEAQAKSEKQLKDFQAGKEKGVKVKQSTLDRLAQRVANLKALTNIYTEAVKIEASWMSEKEKKLFEGQQKIFNILENEQLVESLLQNEKDAFLLIDMLQNVSSAIFKYKDLRALNGEQKQALLSTVSNLSKSRMSNETIQQTIKPLLLTLGTLWKNMPYIAHEKEHQKIGRMEVVDIDGFKKGDRKDRTMLLNAIRQAQDSIIQVNSDLNNILYGNIFLSDFATSKIVAGGDQTAGFYQHALYRNTIATNQDSNTHDADVIHINTKNPFAFYGDIDSNLKKHISQDIISNMQTSIMRDVVVHEIAHRLSVDLLKNQKTNMSFQRDLNSFFKKAKSLPPDLNNKPLKNVTTHQQFLSGLLPLLNYRTSTEGQIKGLLDGTEQDVSVQDISWSNIGDTFATHQDNKSYQIHIPLKNNKTLILNQSGSFDYWVSLFNTKRNSLPTTYANSSAEECFSEMFACICAKNYNVEPLKTSFMTLLNTYSRHFGS